MTGFGLPIQSLNIWYWLWTIRWYQNVLCRIWNYVERFPIRLIAPCLTNAVKTNVQFRILTILSIRAFVRASKRNQWPKVCLSIFPIAPRWIMLPKSFLTNEKKTFLMPSVISLCLVLKTSSIVYSTRSFLSSFRIALLFDFTSDWAKEFNSPTYRDGWRFCFHGHVGGLIFAVSSML